MFPSFTKTWHHSPYAAIDPLQQSLTAHGKVVLITGGGTGIGKATAIAFAQASARAVIITGRRQDRLTAAKGDIEREARYPEGFKCLTFPADVTDAPAMDRVVEEAASAFGKIDIVISNAGYLNKNQPIAESDLNDYWHCFEVNVKGAIIVAQAFLKSKLVWPSVSGPAPVLINITSGAVHLPPSVIPTFSAYSASKLAAFNFFEFLQAEHPGLRVFQLQPGEILTELSKSSGRDRDMDDVKLPACCCVWLAANADGAAEFLCGRLTWANWDVTELVQRSREIVEGDLLRMKLAGWGTEFAEVVVDRVKE